MNGFEIVLDCWGGLIRHTRLPVLDINLDECLARYAFGSAQSNGRTTNMVERPSADMRR